MFIAGHEVDATVLRSLGAASRGLATDYLAFARLALERMVVTPALLDLKSLQRKRGSYARNLLFGDDEVSVWAMVWDVGARTSVHDHHCSCCFGMLAGELLEVSFRAVGGSTALMTSQARRGAGFVGCMLPAGPNLHQMVNDGDVEAVSLHIYGFDHRQQASSVRCEYRVVAQ